MSAGFYILSPEQIQQYYDHINLPKQYRYAPGPEGSGRQSSEIAKEADRGLEFLTVLNNHHECTVPFEDLSLHYSATHAVTIDHDALFDKIVAKALPDGRACNRGGYCMENNGFFLCVLRSLGFDAYAAGARICSQLETPNSDPTYSGWTHQVNIVTIADKRYITDTGVGPSAPTRPLRLDASAPVTAVRNYGTMNMRLRRGPIAGTTRRAGGDADVWIYETQHAPDSPWLAAFCFTDLEFTAADFDMMNYYTSTNREFHMTRRPLASLFLLDEAGDVAGVVVLAEDKVKRRFRDQTETVECKTEAERLDALDRYFGIRFTEEERRGIEGMSSALSGVGATTQ